MTPFRFGDPARRLYGVFHPASARRPGMPAVLMCNPFGQEAVRTHRLYRLLADRLARQGADVLRFDAFATGESDGDDEAGDLPGWCEDLRTAHRELVRRARPASTLWFGARLGAVLAAMAARADAAPARLLLWEPLADGAAYLDELARSHARATYDPYVHDRAPPAPGLAREAIGFGLGEALLAQLRAWRADALAPAGVSAATVVAPPGDAAAQAVAGALGRQGIAVRTVALAHDLVWAAEESMDSALAPAEVLAALQGLVAGDGA